MLGTTGVIVGAAAGALWAMPSPPVPSYGLPSVPPPARRVAPVPVPGVRAVGVAGAVPLTVVWLTNWVWLPSPLEAPFPLEAPLPLEAALLIEAELDALAALASTSTGALNIVAHVRASIAPVGASPWRSWNSPTAPRVSGPKIPSTTRCESGMSSLRRRWAAATRGPSLPNSSTTRRALAVGEPEPIASPEPIDPLPPLAAAIAGGNTVPPASAALMATEMLFLRRRARCPSSRIARR